MQPDPTHHEYILERSKDEAMHLWLHPDGRLYAWDSDDRYGGSITLYQSLAEARAAGYKPTHSPHCYACKRDAARLARLEQSVSANAKAMLDKLKAIPGASIQVEYDPEQDDAPKED